MIQVRAGDKSDNSHIAEQKVAVAIINRNGKKYLRTCLDSLKYQTFKNFETYLIDNASTDDSLEYLRVNFPWVKIIPFEENLGFAGAYNKAIIQLTNVDLVVLLNNDTRVEPDWLASLVNSIGRDTDTIAVGSKLRLFFSPEFLHNAGTKLSFVNAGFDIGLFAKDSEEYNVRRYVGAACGASMIVKRDLFLKIGGFDDSFFAFYEDVDFCWRAWLYGYNVVYEPRSIVYHMRGGSFGSSSPFGTFLGGRNQVLTVAKNTQSRNLFLGIPLLATIFSVRMLLHLKDRRLAHFFSSFRSLLWVINHADEVIRKRTIVQMNRKRNDKYLFSMSILARASESFYENMRLLDSP